MTVYGLMTIDIGEKEHATRLVNKTAMLTVLSNKIYLVQHQSVVGLIQTVANHNQLPLELMAKSNHLQEAKVALVSLYVGRISNVKLQVEIQQLLVHQLHQTHTKCVMVVIIPVAHGKKCQPETGDVFLKIPMFT